jgi:hypothetical protein
MLFLGAPTTTSRTLVPPLSDAALVQKAWELSPYPTNFRRFAVQVVGRDPRWLRAVKASRTSLPQSLRAKFQFDLGLRPWIRRGRPR